MLTAVIGAAFGIPDRHEPEPVAGEQAEAVRAGLVRGEAARTVLPPPIGDPALPARALAICEALRPDNPEADALRRAIRDDPGRVAAWALADRAEASAREVVRLGLNPALVDSVLRIALLPDLARRAAALAPLVEAAGWSQGTCPVCEAPPVLTESWGLEQRWFLWCGRCAAEWPMRRVRCPACGETEPRSFRSLFVAGEEARYRLFRCDACGLALKVVSTIAPYPRRGCSSPSWQPSTST